MKYHAFYIDGNLLIKIKNKECTSYTKEKDISILYNGEQIIGYNIFNFKSSNINEGLVKLSKEINDDVNKRLTEINQEPLEFDDEIYFVVGYVNSIAKHKGSNKLNICQVDLGDKEVQIVCGASNVDAGQKVVVAKVGAVLFNGTWITKGKLLGVESNGMICSEKELALAKESQGILVLDDSYQVGASFFNEN